MKKNIIFVLALALSLFVSCNIEQNVPENGKSKPASQPVANTGSIEIQLSTSYESTEDDGRFEVKIYQLKESSLVLSYSLSSKDEKITVENVPQGKYFLEVSYADNSVGLGPYYKETEVQTSFCSSINVVLNSGPSTGALTLCPQTLYGKVVSEADNKYSFTAGLHSYVPDRFTWYVNGTEKSSEKDFEYEAPQSGTTFITCVAETSSDLYCASYVAGDIEWDSEGDDYTDDLVMSPPPEIAYYRYRAMPLVSASDTGATEQWKYLSLGNEKEKELENLACGIWLFEVRAYSSGAVVLYEGSTLVLVNEENKNVIVPLSSALKDTGTGSIVLEIESPVIRGESDYELVIKYRKAGEGFNTLKKKETNTGEGQTMVWNERLDNLDAGRYLVVLYSIWNSSGSSSVLSGRVCMIDVNAGSLVTIEGPLNYEYSQNIQEILGQCLEIDLLDLIEICEREKLTRTVTGFVDTYSSTNFTQDILSKGGTYTLQGCKVKELTDSVTFEDLGIKVLYKESDESMINEKLCIITASNNDTDSQPSWVGRMDNFGLIPDAAVETIYVNKNIDDEAFMSISKCTRLILGRSPDFTTIGEVSLDGFDEMTCMVIPSNITSIGHHGIHFGKRADNLKIYIAHPENYFDSTCFVMRKEVFEPYVVWNADIPLSEL